MRLPVSFFLRSRSRRTHGLRPARLAVLCAMVLAACSDAPPETALSTDDCRRIDLVDRFGRERLRGAEDITIDEEAGIAYVSAYDRFALDDALAATDEGSSSASLPRGGIYALDLSDAFEAHGSVAPGAPRVRVREVTGAFLGEADFRAHGLDFYSDGMGGKLLAAVVHRYDRSVETGDWVRKSGVALFAVTPRGLETRARIFHEALCHANDVVIVGPNTLLVTRDHGACDYWAHLEDVLALKRSKVVRITLDARGRLDRPPVPVTGGIGLANGIAIDRRERRIIVAATREKALLVYDLDRLIAGNAGRPIGRLSLSGGPDNLTIGPDGRLLAAVHPSLLRVGFFRRRWLDTRTAPAQVVEVDLTRASHETLYHDGEGQTFPAVTVAARTENHILMGSVGARGVQVCRGPEESERRSEEP